MLIKANPANKALAPAVAAVLAEQAPADEAVYPVLHNVQTVDDEQIPQFDGQAPHEPSNVPNPAPQTAHDDVPF